MSPSSGKRNTHRRTSKVLSDALRSPCSFPIGDKTRAEFPRTLRAGAQAMTGMTSCWTYRVRAQCGPGRSSGIPPPSTHTAAIGSRDLTFFGGRYQSKGAYRIDQVAIARFTRVPARACHDPEQ